jgi:hypothetical protein
MSSNTNTDPRARLAQAEADIASVKSFEQQQQLEAEARQAKLAKALATKKALLPDILRADIATEKDQLAAIGEANKKAAQAAQAKLQTAAAAIDKILGDARNAIAEVERTYAQYDEYARHIHGKAYEGFEQIVELDRDEYIQSRGETLGQSEIERVIRQTYGQYVGRLPAAIDPIAAMLLAIQATKSPTQRRLLQGIVWALSNAPNGSTPDPSEDWQPQAEYQFRRGY